MKSPTASAAYGSGLEPSFEMAYILKSIWLYNLAVELTQRRCPKTAQHYQSDRTTQSIQTVTDVSK